MESIVSILFSLGEASRSRKWPDYLEHGFTEDDVPELVQLVLDKDLHEAEGKSKEVWVPLHAWRALGQIGSAEAVEPLLSMFDYLKDDDWALEELPLVMGMIGEQAFEALSDYLADSTHGEYARAMAGHGIKEIVVRNPLARENAVRLLTDYLEQPDPINISLNAIVVNYLIDLKATESIETIRSLYAKGLADLASAGDIEDIEIELGIRKSRSTPKPNYLADSLLSQMPKPADDDIDELIEYFFEKYGSDDSILNISELDGFFASIACSPEMIKPSKWTHAMWGGPGQMPEWETMDEAQSFLSAVMSVYNDVISQMRNKIYEPLYMEARLGGKTHPIVDDWCDGFIKGLALWPRLSVKDEKTLYEKTETIRFFVEEEDFKDMSLNDIFERQDQVENEVVDLYTYFNPTEKRSVVTTFQHETPKVGRNDPCPCGSGKKYKKCCLH